MSNSRYSCLVSLVATATCLITSSCRSVWPPPGVVEWADNEAERQFREEMKKRGIREVEKTQCWEYTKDGFGIGELPERTVATKRRWDWHGDILRARWEFESESDLSEGKCAFLAFGRERFGTSGRDEPCDRVVKSLDRKLQQIKTFIPWIATMGKGKWGEIGGREFAVRSTSDHRTDTMLVSDKQFAVCRRNLLLANGQQTDLTACWVRRDDDLYVFELVTPSPRRDDDFQLMSTWMESLYFLTNSTSVVDK